ncbi:MAG TPA: hypothetical protein VGR27_06470, partial [Longimicrobiaceae bacterium]|nr:hypothetical protein [Longimicrobiaceae bacterium]
MQHAIESVAARTPHLAGEPLLDALVQTGWVDRATAARLLPGFRHFDADRYFAESLRALSFRGTSVADEFRTRVARVVEELAGKAEIATVGEEEGIRFRHGEREGIVLAYPEVALTLGASARSSIAAAVEEMPDALVIVARNFGEGTAPQLAAMLSRTGVPGTLLTVNLLLGIRAMALRYQPGTDRVLDLLGTGRPLRSADIARLGDRKESRTPARA